MLIVLFASGSLGAFLYYAMLKGIVDGKLEKSVSLWSRCVMASALLLSVSATVVIRYFFESTPWLMTGAIWILFTIALAPGYHFAAYHNSRKTMPESDQYK